MVSQKRSIVRLINKYKLVEGGRINKKGCKIYNVPVKEVREDVYEGLI